MMKKFFKKIYRTKEDITKEELAEMVKANLNLVILDVRSEQEFAEGHLRGSINIPLYELYIKAEKVLNDKNAVIVACCQIGVRSKKAIKILRKLGYKNLYNLKGGIE